MGLTNFPNGIASFGMPVLPAVGTTTGKVFFVDSTTGGDGNHGKSKDRPLATIDAAIGKCTADKGDIIYVMPGHTETLTAQINADVAGISIIGLGSRNLRPTLTGNGTIDVIDVSADDITIANIIFAVPSTDAQTSDINIDAAGCSVINTLHHGSTAAKNKVDIITMTANANYALLDGIRVINTTVECPGCFAIEGAATGIEVRNCCVLDNIGFTGGSIHDEATATNLYIHHNVFSNAKANTVVMEFGNNSTGVCSFNHVNGRHTTIASNVSAGTGMAFFENRVVEEAAVNGAIFPAADTE